MPKKKEVTEGDAPAVERTDDDIILQMARAAVQEADADPSHAEHQARMIFAMMRAYHGQDD